MGIFSGLGNLFGLTSAMSGLQGQAITAGADTIQDVTPNVNTDAVIGSDLQGNQGVFQLGDTNLAPGSVTGAFGGTGQGYGSLDKMNTQMNPADATTPGSGLGLDGILKAAAIGSSIWNDYENRKVKKGIANHNIRKDQNARARSQSVQDSLAGGSGQGKKLSGQNYKEI